MRGNRIVIPIKLRKAILENFHESHPGIVKMKTLVRAHVWWPDIDKEIEQLAKSCEICAEVAPQPKKAPLTPWLWPDKPWIRIHSDFLGPFCGKMFLIVINAHSKWAEVKDMGTNTTTERVIDAFNDIFVRYGYPMVLVTDCGRQYKSIEFENFVNSEELNSRSLHRTTQRQMGPLKTL